MLLTTTNSTLITRTLTILLRINRMTNDLQNRSSRIGIKRRIRIITVYLNDNFGVSTTLLNDLNRHINRRTQNATTLTRRRRTLTIRITNNHYLNDKYYKDNKKINLRNLNDDTNNGTLNIDLTLRNVIRLNNLLNILNNRLLLKSLNLLNTLLNIVNARRQMMRDRISSRSGNRRRGNRQLRTRTRSNTSKTKSNPKRNMRGTIRTRRISGSLRSPSINSQNGSGQSGRSKIRRSKYNRRRQLISNGTSQSSNDLASNTRLLELNRRTRRGSRSRYNTNTTRTSSRMLNALNRSDKDILTDLRHDRIINRINGRNNNSNKLSSQKAISTSRPRRTRNTMSRDRTSMTINDDRRKLRRLSSTLNGTRTGDDTRNSIGSPGSNSTSKRKSSILGNLQSIK